jgi:hypothetical protein
LGLAARIVGAFSLGARFRIVISGVKILKNRDAPGLRELRAL